MELGRPFWSVWQATAPAEALVVAVAETDLPSLQADLPEAAEDRGRKHLARPLAAYFQGRSGLMLLRASYSNAGQAVHSLRTLPGNLNGDAAGAMCLVVLGPAVFEAVWRRSPGESTPAAPDVPVRSTRASQMLAGCLDETAVPAALTEELVGNSSAIDLVRRQIVRAAPLDHPVLIEGETGCGKEIIATQIHHLGKRRGKPLVVVNCAALPEALLESELFGHARGAFTGASTAKRGLWARADGGTLFLDEVGELPLNHQTKLLRALESGTFTPVGQLLEERSNARVVAATNRNLRSMIKTGHFRADLFFRLFMLNIHAPSLRERLDDVPLIADQLWHSITDGAAPALPPSVKQLLASHHWPGNVRELKSFLVNLHFLFENREPDPKLVEVAMEERLGYRKRAGTDR